jgi:hypothetical protein
MVRLDPEDEPLLEEIRSAQRRASESVAEILNDEQKETVCRLFESRPPGSAQEARRQAREVPADSMRLGPGGGRASTWSWCSPAPNPAERSSEVTRTG